MRRPQRFVKQELLGLTNDALMMDLDRILNELDGETGGYGLVNVKDEEYHCLLLELKEIWKELKVEIGKIRQGEVSYRVMQVSEKHFRVANQAAFEAQRFTEGKIESITKMHRMMMASLGLGVIYLFHVLQIAKLQLKNKELNVTASIDKQTRLPNRSECDRVLMKYNNRALPQDLTVISMNLNNLKCTNDQYGHSVGDVLITTFASHIHEVSKEFGFVGRNGGDEFIGIFENCDSDKIEEFLAKFQARIDTFNHREEIVQVSHAYGYAIKEEFGNYDIYDLLRESDARMYLHKKKPTMA